ncbi:hypothetical protein Tco_0244460, partial [Tanacetum coccineum]
MQGEDLSEEDFAKRMVDMVNQRKKYFAEERAKYGEDLQTGTSKKQKTVDDTGSAELQEKVAAKDVPVIEEKLENQKFQKKKKLKKTAKEEDMEANDAIHVATKSHVVVNWKIF